MNAPTLPPVTSPWSPSDVRAARAHLGLSAAALARALGMSDGRTVRRWETETAGAGGRRGITFEVRWRLAELVREHRRRLNRK